MRNSKKAGNPPESDGGSRVSRRGALRRVVAGAAALGVGAAAWSEKALADTPTAVDQSCRLVAGKKVVAHFRVSGFSLAAGALKADSRVVDCNGGILDSVEAFVEDGGGPTVVNRDGLHYSVDLDGNGLLRVQYVVGLSTLGSGGLRVVVNFEQGGSPAGSVACLVDGSPECSGPPVLRI